MIGGLLALAAAAEAALPAPPFRLDVIPSRVGPDSPYACRSRLGAMRLSSTSI